MASSGTRIGETIKVKLSDVNLTRVPPEIVIRDAKDGDTRKTFISQEAKDAIQEWLKVRDQYLIAAKDRNKGLSTVVNCKPKDVNDDRLFPFSERTVRTMWANALAKAGILKRDSSTGRLQLRKHGLRKFFRSQLALSCPVDIVEALFGHEGYLTDAYRRYTTTQMGEYYLKAEHHVTIFSGDDRDIRDRLQAYRAKIQEQEEDLASLQRLYIDQEKRMTQIEYILERAIENPAFIEDLGQDPRIKKVIPNEQI